jgi:diacylglycerol kinase family enzyme
MPTERPQAVLIVNPNAGRMADRLREDVVDALRARFRLDAYSTTARHTGITLASDAAAAGADLVIAFGGDGHVNEVVNGLAHTDTALAVVPGGTMNAFARALGVPRDPFGAVDHLVRGLANKERVVPLGRVDERFFTFSAGCGFDAEAAQRVDRYVPAKRRFGEAFFFWSAFRVLAGSYRRRDATMRLKGDFGEVPLAMAIACNAGPYAYLFGRPIQIAPQVRLEGGLDVFGLRSMRIENLPFYAWRCLWSGKLVDHPDVFYESDLDAFALFSDEPFERHVDGEPLPPARSAHFSLERAALKVRP